MRRIKPDISTSSPRRPGVTQELKILEGKRGRAAKYTPEVPDLVRRMTAVGQTIAQMAQNLHIGEGTLENWLQHRTEVREAYEAGKWEDNLMMSECLKKKAMGYEYEQIQELSGTDSLGREWTKTIRTIKRVEPDTAALIFWKKNREPENWRGDHDGQGTNNTQINIKNTLNFDRLSPEQRDMMGQIAIDRIIAEDDTHDVEEQ